MSKPKVFLFQDPNVAMPTVLAMNEDGHVIARSTALVLDSAQSSLLDELGRIGVTGRTAAIEWVDAPADHAELQAACRRAEEAPERVGLPLVEHRVARARLHQCDACSHGPVCLVADALRRAAGLQAIVTGCLGFEAPVPLATSPDEWLARLQALAQLEEPDSP